ncbi:hypothetical protein GCM10025881_14820 [Pseudolysinimonas kribbensis]|uniref:Uncharacterized protein n=1 Tax=Pseudolysinimonas kribbensis TaxID=433641 RepID=A0ABQ6K2H8_9MICO|nr:hypothetical protein GCM10025881_14820 [Pseudolysinimonas kribbensis]
MKLDAGVARCGCGRLRSEIEARETFRDAAQVRFGGTRDRRESAQRVAHDSAIRLNSRVSAVVPGGTIARTRSPIRT